MARPEVSCHPETLLPARARSSRRRSATTRPGRSPGRGGPAAALHVGRPYAELREKLDALGRRLGGAYRVLVDANQHVDREGAARAGVGFYGKNTMLITRRLRLVGRARDARHRRRGRADAAARRSTAARAGSASTRARPARSTSPGTLDATRCLSYWTQAPAPIPEEYRAPLGDRVYGCDICQDVCPWNRGVEKRRRRRAAARGEPTVSLVEWLRADDDELASATTACTCRATTRATCGGTRSSRSGTPAARSTSRSLERPRRDDELLAEHAEWALERIEERA